MLPLRTSPRFFNEEGYECLIVLTRSPVAHQRLSLRAVHFLLAEKWCTSCTLSLPFLFYAGVFVIEPAPGPFSRTAPGI